MPPQPSTAAHPAPQPELVRASPPKPWDSVPIRSTSSSTLKPVAMSQLSQGVRATGVATPPGSSTLIHSTASTSNLATPTGVTARQMTATDSSQASVVDGRAGVGEQTTGASRYGGAAYAHSPSYSTAGGSMYGSSYGYGSRYMSDGMYGGGYGMGRYRGYPGLGMGGYGTMYGGIGGAYGYGGMYGGPRAAMGPEGGLLWLQNTYHVVSSLGHMTELLGMNTEALGHLFGTFMGLMETLGGVLSQVCHAPGQAGVEAEDRGAKQANGRVRVLRWVLGVLVSFVMFRVARRVMRALIGGGGGFPRLGHHSRAVLEDAFAASQQLRPR